MLKTSTGFRVAVCLRIAGILLLFALSFMLLASMILTICIQNEYINITYIAIAGCIIHALVGYVGVNVTTGRQNNRGIREMIAAIVIVIFIQLALVSLIFDGITMEWGWGILCMVGGNFLAMMVQNHKNKHTKKGHNKYRTR